MGSVGKEKYSCLYENPKGVNMKLLFCMNCQDVVKINTTDKRFCQCGKCWGAVLDKNNIETIGGKVEVSDNEYTVVLGIDNRSLKPALVNFHINRTGIDFNAFVISESCSTVTRIK